MVLEAKLVDEVAEQLPNVDEAAELAEDLLMQFLQNTNVLAFQAVRDVGSAEAGPGRVQVVSGERQDIENIRRHVEAVV